MKPLTGSMCVETLEDKLSCSIHHSDQRTPLACRIHSLHWNLAYREEAWVFSIEGLPQIRFQNYGEATSFLDHFQKLVSDHRRC
jgi:hypothetical protein